MIFLLEGKPGSGKTYEAVFTHILPALLSGRKVITSVSLNIEFLTKALKIPGHLIEVKPFDYKNKIIPFQTIEDFKDDWEREIVVNGKVTIEKPLVVIDEAHFIFRARPLAHEREAVREMIDFMSMHRHDGLDVILITQSIRRIHPDLVEMIEAFYYVRSLGLIGAKETYQHTTYAEPRSQTKDYLKREKRKYVDSVFKAYKSHSQAQGEIHQGEVQEQAQVLRRYYVVLAIGFILVGYFIFKSVNVLFGDDSPLSTDETEDSHVVDVEEEPKRLELPSVKSSTEYLDLERKLKKLNEEVTIMKAERKVYIREPDTSVDDALKAPYDGFKMNLKAQIVGDKKAVYLYSLVKDEQEVLLTGAELGEAGYTIRSISDCLHIVDHKYTESSQYVYCNKVNPVKTKKRVKVLPGELADRLD